MIGAPSRLLVDRAVARVAGHPLVWGTLIVNVLGSFVLGCVAGAGSSSVRTVVGVGFCGSFTTFSTFAFETLHLFESGQRRLGLANLALSITLGLGAAAAGWAIVAR